MKLKKITLLIICFLTGWIIFAQFCMKFRKPDKKAKKIFAKAGVSLYTETIDAHEYRLHYAKTGEDSLPTLFFVHGTPGSWMKFQKYLMDKDLLKKFRMVSVDRPGFGYSQFGDARDLRQQSEIISVLLKHLQNGKPVYATGHSYGGSLVVRLAVDNPGLFSGLVLIAAALDPVTEKKYFWRQLLSKIPLKYLVPGAWRPSNKELIYFKKDLEEMKGKVSVINCPVHLLHGDADDLVPVSNAEYGKKILANAKPLHVTILPGAHHHISDDHYKIVKELLLNKLY